MLKKSDPITITATNPHISDSIDSRYCAYHCHIISFAETTVPTINNAAKMITDITRTSSLSTGFLHHPKLRKYCPNCTAIIHWGQCNLVNRSSLSCFTIVE